MVKGYNKTAGTGHQIEDILLKSSAKSLIFL
jgi:hypothetical protein